MDIVLGFAFGEVKSWKQFIVFLHQPRNASILAYSRILFGILMVVDIPQERGMTRADTKYGDDSKEICRFPFFSVLKPLPADYMSLLYAILVISAVGIILGCFYHLSCVCFTSIYWYIFLLDKSTWNNHSYLYGLLSFLFLLTDAHRYMSVDGFFQSKIRNSHVPLWHYTLLRFQVFLVYFYAGLKKTELDWLMGYSMHKLTKHWVFDPLRLFLNESMMDLFVVHYGGFLLDISAGFLLFFGKTRYVGFVMCGMFHVMNSQLFNIGMFPYMMLGTMFVFCAENSFERLLDKICSCLRSNGKAPIQKNTSCIYQSEKGPIKISWKQTLASMFTVAYIIEQLFLPYSHPITKGYNGWTEGPYGYSWDMMVHSFSNQHIRIIYKDIHGEQGYLKPGAFLHSTKSRWSAHPDMTIQYACCLKERLIELNIEEPSIYFDVWKSMNGRFQQRVVDPTVDLASYKWSPFRPADFVLPVLSELTGWRDKLLSMREEIKNQSLSVVFVADFPGMTLENFVQSDFANTTIEVLDGSISIEVASSKTNTSLSPGESMQVPSGEFHSVTTISTKPSCYFYKYYNGTEQDLANRVENYRKKTEAAYYAPSLLDIDEDPLVVQMYEKEELRKRSRGSRTFLDNASFFVFKKFHVFRRSFLLSCYAIRNIVLGKPDQEQLEAERNYMDNWLVVEQAGLPDEVPQSKTEL